MYLRGRRPVPDEGSPFKQPKSPARSCLPAHAPNHKQPPFTSLQFSNMQVELLFALVGGLAGLSAGAPVHSEPEGVATTTTTMTTTATATATAAPAQLGFDLSPPNYSIASSDPGPHWDSQAQAQAHIAQLLSRGVSAFAPGGGRSQRPAGHPPAAGKCARRTRTWLRSQPRAPNSARSGHGL